MTDYADLVHQYALAYAGRKIPIFPVRVTDDGVKFPAIKGGHGHLDATCDVTTIEMWFGPGGLYRGCGLGGYLAQADPPMAAVDIDVKNGGAGPEQYESLQDSHGAIDDTVRVLTPTGGWHDWVGMNGAKIGSTNGGLPNSPDIDIKGVGGWVVLPPTRLADGREYAFEDGHKPSEIAVVVDPGWIARLCPARMESEGGGGRWRDVKRDELHPLDLRALVALEALGGHSPFIGGDGCVHVTRPGKSAGTSANIGYLGPGIVGVRTPNWKALGGPRPALVPGDKAEDLRVYELDQLEKLVGAKSTPENPKGRLVLTSAKGIKPRRVRWMWADRLPVGTLALLAGPEGLGKSTLAYTIAARVTKGLLAGENYGTPRAVIISATEDSWEHTIVPRLMAADADLGLVYRVEAKEADDIMVGLSLPDDLVALEAVANETDAALLLLDPLMSRLHGALDTHRDGDVRRGLEPLVSVADNTGMTIWGVIHHNKSGSTDPLQLVMASKAFTAVARSVHTVIKDPEDETGMRRFFGTVKSNLGRIDLPTLSFTIQPWFYDTDDGEGSTGQLVLGEETAESVGDIMARAAQSAGPEKDTKQSSAKRWLSEFMAENGPEVLARIGMDAAEAAGFSESTMKRARTDLGVKSNRRGGLGGDGHWIWTMASTTPTSDVLDSSTLRASTSANDVTQSLRSQVGVSPRACARDDEAEGFVALDELSDSTPYERGAEKAAQAMKIRPEDI